MAHVVLKGPAPALVTPFTDDDKVNTDAIPPMVEYFIGSGVKGLYLCGSTGSGIAMTKAERMEMTEATCKAVAKRVPVIVMVGACPVEEAVELAVHAKKCGAAAISATVPGAYAWLKNEEVKPDLGVAIAYFKTVAGATDLPFWPYWLGGSLASSAPEFLEAMNNVPNFKGMKYTTPDMYTFQQIRFLSEKAGTPLNLVTGADEMFICGCVMKSDGGIGSTYNLMPKLFVKLYDTFHAGDTAKAMELQEQINQVIALLIEQCYCRERGTNILSGITAVLRKRGFAVGKPRQLLLSRPFTAEQEQALCDAIDALDFTVE
eukprot:m.178884 g.178884  ORF g.178884 m.178884 type:complete len:318 (+) comp14645_c0_seq1:59-1012(+)